MPDELETFDQDRALAVTDLRAMASRLQADARSLLPESLWQKLAQPLNSDHDARGLLAVSAYLSGLAEGAAKLTAEIAEANAMVEGSIASQSVAGWIFTAGNGKRSIDYGRACGKLAVRSSIRIEIPDPLAFLAAYPELGVTPPPPPPRPDKAAVKKMMQEEEQTILVDAKTGAILAELVREDKIRIEPPGAAKEE